MKSDSAPGVTPGSWGRGVQQLRRRTLRQGCIASLLIAASMPSAATWVQIGSDRSVDFFIDPDTRARSGNEISVQLLSAFDQPKQIRKRSYRSTLESWRVDCNQEKIALIASSALSGEMGTGDVVYTEDIDSQWISVKRGQLSQKLLEAACGS